MYDLTEAPTAREAAAEVRNDQAWETVARLAEENEITVASVEAMRDHDWIDAETAHIVIRDLLGADVACTDPW